MRIFRSKYALPVALGIAVVLLLAAVPVIADLAISYTLRPVTAADCLSVSVSRQTNGQGGTVLVATFTFEVKDTNGAVRETGATTIQLTPAQASSLATFITNNGVPAFNTQRGL